MKRDSIVFEEVVKMAKGKKLSSNDDWKYSHDVVFGTPIRTKKNGKTQKLVDTGDILHPGPKRWKNA